MKLAVIVFVTPLKKMFVHEYQSSANSEVTVTIGTCEMLH